MSLTFNKYTNAFLVHLHFLQSLCNTHFTFTFSFRLGKMYRYTIEKFDIKSLTNFATGFYKNVKAESIPMPKTPL
jgi:hypothetical protein